MDDKKIKEFWALSKKDYFNHFKLKNKDIFIFPKRGVCEEPDRFEVEDCGSVFIKLFKVYKGNSILGYYFYNLIDCTIRHTDVLISFSNKKASYSTVVNNEKILLFRDYITILTIPNISEVVTNIMDLTEVSVFNLGD